MEVARGEDRLRTSVLRALEAGYQLSPGALQTLKELPEDIDPVEVVEKALETAQARPELLLIDEELVRNALKPPPPPEESVGATYRPQAADIEEDVEILMDPTGALDADGSVDGYLRYFRDRFQRLERILRRRMDVRDANTIRAALKAPNGSRVKIVGMVTEKRGRGGRVFITLEDLEDSITVVASPKSGRNVVEEAGMLLLDQVVCVVGVKVGRDLVVAEEFIWPDVPQRHVNGAREPVYAAFTSDIHYGSRKFMEDAFRRFLRWLRGELGNSSLRELAGRVKYLVVAGDLVDGIGVYPGQREELAVESLYEQYRGIADLLELVPDYVSIIVIPGNHDASRKALPQPAIFKEYAEALYEAIPLHSLGNPSLVRLHGVDALLYHGQSLDDLASSIPGVSFHTPCRAMKLMLRARHLAPIYGAKTSIAPEARDLLIIDEPPHILQTGHIHVVGRETYRGTLLLNSGAWQEQTNYQRRMGLEPTPGLLPVVNLQTLEVITLDFTKPEITVAS